MPPVPSDAAVALGAFLSHRGVTTSARRVPRDLGVEPDRRGRRLLRGDAAMAAGCSPRPRAAGSSRRARSPSSSASISGSASSASSSAAFFPASAPWCRRSRAWLASAPIRTLVPMGLASAIWYGGLTLLGALIGVGVGAHQRAHRQRQPDAGSSRRWSSPWPAASGIWCAAGSAGASGSGMPPGMRSIRPRPRFWPAPTSPKGSARQAAALVVLELAYADPVLTPDDRRLIAEHLHGRWGLAEPAARRRPRRPRTSGARDSPTTPAGSGKRVGRPERLELVERMWTVAFADGAIGAHEARLMHLAARAARAQARRAGRRVAARCRRSGDR